ncbi:hypothetical protein NQ318_004721 [Aromia moschata]|uniref:Uncharacterized protein n=1 Tax=Aromia moschata TaxID=1265417 RepID=A0AAV8Y381_9CUCU|nr:hypothetical protein NQ318_004721 [Aromia moschata]
MKIFDDFLKTERRWAYLTTNSSSGTKKTLETMCHTAYPIFDDLLKTDGYGANLATDSCSGEDVNLNFPTNKNNDLQMLGV